MTLNIDNSYEILTPNGWSDFERIIKTKKTGSVKILTENGKNILCTIGHRILNAEDKFVFVEDLFFGDKILTSDGIDVIIDIEIDEFYTDFFYDAKNVEKRNRYYTNDIISHNCAEFIGSSNTLIAGWKLKELVDMTPIHSSEEMKQYDLPIENHKYVLLADVSEGKYQDYSVFSIIDITQMPYKQVFVYRNNKIQPMDYASIIQKTAILYNEAYIMVEINSIGVQVGNSLLHEFEYENMLFTETSAQAKRSGKFTGKQVTGVHNVNTEKGIKTTTLTKSAGCGILKKLIEGNMLIVNDKETISELSTFSARGKSFEAEKGKNDDIVMTLVIFAWLSETDYFKHLTDIKTLNELRNKSEEDVNNDLLGFGYRHDGIEKMISDYTIIENDVWETVWNNNDNSY